MIWLARMVLRYDIKCAPSMNGHDRKSFEVVTDREANENRYTYMYSEEEKVEIAQHFLMIAMSQRHQIGLLHYCRAL